MRTFRRILGFVLVFIATVLIMTFLLTPASGIRVLLKQAKEGEYSALIMGESHAECGYNPYIISEGLGEETVSVARRVTPIINMYYIMQEANVDKKYKTVILDIDPFYWRLAQIRDVGTDMDLTRYLTGIRKLKYIKEIVWADRFIRLFSDYMLSWENIEKIPDNISAKTDVDYIINDDEGMNAVNKYLKSDTLFDYEGRGFLRGARKASDPEWEHWVFGGAVVQENIDSLQRIKDYCEDNGIRLVCTQSALPPIRFYQQNIGEIHDCFNNLLSGMGIEYYDFNYAKSEYLYRTDQDYVDEDGHMMGELADRQSKLLCDVMNSDNPKQYFYNSYDEVLANLN